MAKEKVFGVLETDTTLLEPVSEKRYGLEGKIDEDLVGCWVTVAGEVNGVAIRKVEISNVEKFEGKATRSGTIVASAPNLPQEANGAGGYLYQEKKGRYFLLSEGAVNEPISGDFSEYVGKNVKASGEFGSANYVLYNARVTVK